MGRDNSREREREREREKETESSSRKHGRHDDKSYSPSHRHSKRADENSISPPRRERHGHLVSPPRRDNSSSPPRREKKKHSISPSRRERHRHSRSPARRERHRHSRSPPRRERHEKESTVYRDKSGRKIDKHLERLEKAKRDREQEEREAQHMEWGKGKVQARLEQKRKVSEEEMKTAPFARSRDDEEMNRSMREQVRWDDPTRHFVKTEKKQARAIYKGYCPPNRFNIRPGHLWDGVDRSNGFEKTYFEAQAKSSAISEIAYKWSTEDM